MTKPLDNKAHRKKKILPPTCKPSRRKLGHFHLHMRKGAKSAGANALNRHAYIAGIGNHASREDVIYTSAGNMPANVSEIEFWAAADLHDSGNLYREIELALPRELTWEQRIELAETFAETVTMGSPYSLSIHAPIGSDGKEQPHLHLMFSERTNDNAPRESIDAFFKRANSRDPMKGGAKKNREFKEFGFLKKVRALGAKMQNDALKSVGYSVRVTHQSYEALGWQRPAGVHLGPYHAAKRKQGKPTKRVLRQEAIEKAQEQYKEYIKIRKETRYVEQQLRKKIERLKLTQADFLNAGAEHLTEDAISRISKKRKEQIQKLEEKLNKITKTKDAKNEDNSSHIDAKILHEHRERMLESDLPNNVKAKLAGITKKEETQPENDDMISINTIITAAKNAKRAADDSDKKRKEDEQRQKPQEVERKSKHIYDNGLGK